MPIAIIMVPESGEESAERMRAAGFVEEKMWRKHVPGFSNDETEASKARMECMRLRARQFIIGDFTGMGPD